jgi:transcriptional regulator with XRE-family HTH domain
MNQVCILRQLEFLSLQHYQRSIMSHLGARLRDIRIQARETQQEFAASIGISQGYLSELERGIKSIIGSDIIIAIKERYGVSADWLLSQELEVKNLEDIPHTRPPGEPPEPGVREATSPYEVSGANTGSAALEFQDRMTASSFASLRVSLDDCQRERVRLEGQVQAYERMFQSLKLQITS